MDDPTDRPKITCPDDMMVVTHYSGSQTIMTKQYTPTCIMINPERSSVKIEMSPSRRLYFDNLDEARQLRDMLNILLEMSPTIKPHVPKY